MGEDWGVMVRSTKDDSIRVVRAPFVFVGAGGYALPLLQKSGIDEIRGFGGFPSPASGCAAPTPRRSPATTRRSTARPPWSSADERPHLDTRYVGGKRALMFGPYAVVAEVPQIRPLHGSVRVDEALEHHPDDGRRAPNLDLMVYLGSQLAATHQQRFDALLEYMPEARTADWEEVTAGQRVQVIAPTRRSTACCSSARS